MEKHKHTNDLTLRLFDRMNSRDFSDADEYMTEDIRFDFPGVPTAQGQRRTLLLLNALLRKYPELVFSVHDVIAEGYKSVAVWTNKGVDNAGKHYENSGMTLLQFHEDKINYISDYFKDTSLIETK